MSKLVALFGEHAEKVRKSLAMAIQKAVRLFAKDVLSATELTSLISSLTGFAGDGLEQDNWESEEDTPLLEVPELKEAKKTHAEAVKEAVKKASEEVQKIKAEKSAKSATSGTDTQKPLSA